MSPLEYSTVTKKPITNTAIEQPQPPDPAGNSGFGLGLARAFWTLLGPLLLFGAIAYNVVSPTGWLSRWDASVALIVAAMIACRWLDQSSGKAQTAYGEPSTPEQARLYSIILVVVAAAAWAIANVVGNHLMK